MKIIRHLTPSGPLFQTSLTASNYNLSGQSMLGGPYGPGGIGAFFAITDPSTATLYRDVCR